MFTSEAKRPIANKLPPLNANEKIEVKNLHTGKTRLSKINNFMT
jgi:hypothetical protein